MFSGDKFSRSGTLEGGYVNPNHSRLLFQKKIWELQAKLEKQETDLTQVKEQLNKVDGENTKVLSEIQKSEMTHVQLRYVNTLNPAAIVLSISILFIKPKDTRQTWPILFHNQKNHNIELYA